IRGINVFEKIRRRLWFVIEEFQENSGAVSAPRHQAVVEFDVLARVGCWKCHGNKRKRGENSAQGGRSLESLCQPRCEWGGTRPRSDRGPWANAPPEDAFSHQFLELGAIGVPAAPANVYLFRVLVACKTV